MKITPYTRVTLKSGDGDILIPLAPETVEVLVNVLKFASTGTIPHRSPRIACIKLLRALAPGWPISRYLQFYEEAIENLEY